jgi:sugar O-acyltransferase (sialic acid O-acetyltransferase NeuD family)
VSQRVVMVSIDKDLIDLVRSDESFDLVGIIDTNASADALGAAILGNDDDWPAVQRDHPGIKAILAVDGGLLRKRLASHYGLTCLADVRAADSYVSPDAAVGGGCVLQRGVKVLADAQIGIACKVSVNATVHHDCVVADYCVIAPGAQLLGDVRVGEAAFIGAGAVVLPHVRIGNAAVIGAGAVVARDVPDGMIAAGVPASTKRFNGELKRG